MAQFVKRYPHSVRLQDAVDVALTEDREARDKGIPDEERIGGVALVLFQHGWLLEAQGQLLDAVLNPDRWETAFYTAVYHMD